jgi:protein-tyrosine phosphatase
MPHWLIVCFIFSALGAACKRWGGLSGNCLPVRKPDRVLFVCLGNICRSPTAEGVFRHLLTQHASLHVEVDSAGTADYHLGKAPDARSQSAALRRGVDISDLRARQVTIVDFADFDFVLAMDRNNLRALGALRPRGSPVQLRLLLDYAPEQPLREVPDPYYGGASTFNLVLDLVAAASRGLIEVLQKRAQQPEQASREGDRHR